MSQVVLFLKAHVGGYTRRSGTYVAPHERGDTHVHAAQLPLFGGEPAASAPAESKKFYVTMVRNPGRDQQVAKLAGPFDEHEHALAHVEEAQRYANEIDPRSHFDYFGTSGITAAEHRPGVLNRHMGLGDVIATRYTGDEGHPAPIPRQSIAHLHDLPRERWKAAHREQHEITYHHLPRVKKEMDKHQKAINAAVSEQRENEHALKDPLMQADQARVAAHRQAADAAHARYKAALESKEAAVAQHAAHYERAAHLGRIKEHIMPGTGDIRYVPASGQLRNAAEEKEHAKSYARAYADYYKGK